MLTTVDWKTLNTFVGGRNSYAQQRNISKSTAHSKAKLFVTIVTSGSQSRLFSFTVSSKRPVESRTFRTLCLIFGIFA